MKLVHMPGTRMVQLDALSRRSDYIHGEDTDNENKILLPDYIFIKLINTKLAEEIKNAVGKDKLFAKASEVLKQTGNSKKVYYFSKVDAMSHQMQILNDKSSKDIMIQNPQDTQGNGEHKTLSQEDIGG
jgi:hypothetical protein